MRRGLKAFPFPQIAKSIRDKYYIEGGKAANTPYKSIGLHAKEPRRELAELCMAANFVEVWLAREGNGNPVGINYLEKVQIPHLPSIYGAMLADVSYVIMGAGIPIKVPGVLDAFVNHEAATYSLSVSGSRQEDDTTISFDPADFMECNLAPLNRPKFLAIISSNVLAATMLKRANGTVDGFVIEGPTAGGHNAPPRGKMQLNAEGEAIYGERDQVDLGKIRELGVPFWMAGGYGSAEKLRDALAQGASGVQVGTAFALCEESGLRDEYKHSLIGQSLDGASRVFTDPFASPTGFPFKSASIEGTASKREVYEARPRICDLGYLREAYRTADGGIGYRCSAEPVSAYISKGGRLEDTVGRKCLCNSLLANIGHAQRRGANYDEVGFVTAGNDVANVPRFIPEGRFSYTAADVIKRLLEQ